MKSKNKGLGNADVAVLRKTQKNTAAVIAISVIILSFFAVMAYLFPYSGDDWSWGGIVGLEKLKEGFVNENGRYAGNLLVIALTRVQFLNIIAKSVFFYLACLLSYKFSDKQRVSALLFSFMLILIVPSEILIQDYAWTSGFTNYVPPIVIFAAYLVLIRNIFYSQKPTYSKVLVVPAFFMGFIGCLFMENITIYCIVAAAAVIVYCRKKFKKVFDVHILYLIGALLGAIVMFTNPVYIRVLKGADYYRTAGGNGEKGLLGTILYTCYRTFHYLFSSNSFVAFILTVLAIYVLCSSLKSGKIVNRKAKYAAIIASVVNVITLCVFIIDSFVLKGNYDNKSAAIVLPLFAAAVLYYLSLGVSVLISLDGVCRTKAAFLILSIPVMVAPLLLVTPVGSRNFFPPFMFMVMLAVLLFNYALDNRKKSPKCPKPAVVFISLVCFFVSMFYVGLYAPIHSDYVARNEKAISDAQKSDEITIHKLPESEYIWEGNPSSKRLQKRFKSFYGIDKNVKINYVEDDEDEEQSKIDE